MRSSRWDFRREGADRLAGKGFQLGEVRRAAPNLSRWSEGRWNASNERRKGGGFGDGGGPELAPPASALSAGLPEVGGVKWRPLCNLATQNNWLYHLQLSWLAELLYISLLKASPRGRSSSALES